MTTYQFNARDERGWRIPRPGTMSAAVYEMLLRGRSVGAIARKVKRSTNSVGVLIWKIKHPDAANALNKPKYAVQRAKAHA